MISSEITLHPQAWRLLFQHFDTTVKIFGNVLGQLEIDYLSIALLTHKNELLFFSSRPAIEFKLTQHPLWLADVRFQDDFFQQEQAQFWTDKCKLEGVGIGLSIPSVFDGHRVIYTVASKSKDKNTHDRISSDITTIVGMGRFCLKCIMSEVPYMKHFIQTNSNMSLIIDNGELK